MSDANMNIIVNNEGDDENNNNKVDDILKDAVDEVQRVIEQNNQDAERIAKEREAALEAQMLEVKAIEAQVDKKLQDVLLSVDQTEDVIQAIDPANIELDPETVKKLNTAPKSTAPVGPSLTANMLETRVENLQRTLETKMYKGFKLDLEPFLDNVREKSSKVETQEELDKLIAEQAVAQIGKIKDFETSLTNSIEILRTTVDNKITNILSAMEEGQNPEENFAFQQYTRLLETLYDAQQTVTQQYNESVNKVKTNVATVAKEGFDIGDTERQLKEAEARRKEEQSIVDQFNKEFEKYAKEQKEALAAEHAYTVAQNYLDSTRDAKMSVAKAMYSNAKTDFLKNAKSAPHGLSDDDILAMYASQGGTFQPPTPQFDRQPEKYTGSGGMPPGSPPNNFSQTNLMPQDDGGPAFNRMLLDDAIRAIVEPFIDLKELITDVVLRVEQLMVEATSPQRISPQSMIKAGANTAQQTAEFGVKTGATIAGGVAGASAGAVIGSVIPGAGTVAGIAAGAALGSVLGEQLGELIPIEEMGQMVAALYDISDNITKQATPFSPELIAAGIDKQLMFLEENIMIADKYGSEMAELQAATNELQITFYQKATEFFIQILPILIIGVNALTELVRYGGIVVQFTIDAASGNMWKAIANAAAGIAKTKKRSLAPKQKFDPDASLDKNFPI